MPFVARPFEGLAGETDYVALREVVPAATAPLTVAGHEDRTVVLCTVLPGQWPALVRADGQIMLGLQVAARSGDASRDLGWVLEQALVAEPGLAVTPSGLPEPGPRLQDLLVDAPLEVTVHDGFDFWIAGATPSEEAAASLEQANASVVPTERLTSVASAYWCRMKERSHLRWVLPEKEDAVLDGMARLGGAPALSLGEGSRYVGSFRAHGLLVPVWDLPVDAPAGDWDAPAAALRERLSTAIAEVAGGAALTAQERRARQGLLARQLTLR